eukprot:5520212-Pyramimonas_sp.AAC.1
MYTKCKTSVVTTKQVSLIISFAHTQGRAADSGLAAVLGELNALVNNHIKQTETVVWNHQRATADKPYCSAGRWETVDGGQCERSDGIACGSLGGSKKVYMEFVTDETTCETPQPRKTACSLPACDISEPLSGYY